MCDSEKRTRSKHPNYSCLKPGYISMKMLKKNFDDDDFDFHSTLGVDGQIDDKVDGAVEDEEEVGGLGEEVDHIRFQVLNSIACRKSKSCCS